MFFWLYLSRQAKTNRKWGERKKRTAAAVKFVHVAHALPGELSGALQNIILTEIHSDT